MKHIFFLFFLFLAGNIAYPAGPRILFIGDSITDGNWGNSNGSAQPSAARNHWI